MSIFDIDNRQDVEAEAPSAVSWPQWAEDARLDDDLAAEAYEATPAPLRAAVKTGLALAHMHFGESTTSQRNEVRNAHLGFWRRSIAHPAPWAVIAFTPADAAAARLACRGAGQRVPARVHRLVACLNNLPAPRPLRRPAAKLLIGAG